MDYEIGADSDDLSDIIDSMAGAPRQRLRASGQMLLGIGSTSVAAGATATIQVTLLEPFRPRQLVLGAAARASDDVRVTDIRIGRTSQLAGAGEIPASLFTPDAAGGGLKGDTASPTTGIQIVVRNAGAAAVVVTGAFRGDTA